MATLLKFVFGCSVLAAVFLFGACFLNPANAGSQTGLKGADAMMRRAAAGVETFARAAYFRAATNLRRLTSSAAVDSNVNTARLQINGMTNSVIAATSQLANVSGIDTGSLHRATRNASITAQNMSTKVPVVAALRVRMDHLSDLHPAFASSRITF